VIVKDKVEDGTALLSATHPLAQSNVAPPRVWDCPADPAPTRREGRRHVHGPGINPAVWGKRLKPGAAAFSAGLETNLLRLDDRFETARGVLAIT
jgi:hypothetical protein